MVLSVTFNTLQLAFIRTLRGLTRKFGCFDDEQFDGIGLSVSATTRHWRPVPDIGSEDCRRAFSPATMRQP